MDDTNHHGVTKTDFAPRLVLRCLYRLQRDISVSGERDRIYRQEVLKVLDDGTGPALFAGGEFAAAGGVTVNRIAKWDGVTWHALDGRACRSGHGHLGTSRPTVGAATRAVVSEPWQNSTSTQCSSASVTGLRR